MKRTAKFFLVLLMLFSSFFIFAEGVFETSESASVTGTVKDTETVAKSLINDYLNSLEEYQNQYEKLYTALQMAYEKGDADAYVEARKSLRNLVAPEISQEQSKAIEQQIVENNDLETAKLLFQYSRYYRPSLTLKAEENGFNYKSSVAVVPGSEIVLPELRISNKALSFIGWGYDSENVAYQAGEKIQMPLSDTVLYAVFEKDGSLIEGASVVLGNFKIDKVEMEEEKIFIPRARQFDFDFEVKNNGTENLSDIEVSFDSDDPLLVILTDKLTSRYITSCDSKIATFRVITKASSGTKLNGVITVKDSNEHIWTKEVTFVVE